jgi:methylated-DNA-[protein]-cysteine S-methyltransferase
MRVKRKDPEPEWVVAFPETPPELGPLWLCFTEQGLAALEFAGGQSSPKHAAPPSTVIPFINQARDALADYFRGLPTDFAALSLAPRGTPFQLRVWQELRRIPWGQTISYKELAQRVGSPKASRAVGQANAVNPLPVIIPCHRVIAADGGLGGYSSGLDRKDWLLRHEGAR